MKRNVYLIIIFLIFSIGCNIQNLSYTEDLYVHTVKVKLQGGRLNQDTGNIIVATESREEFCNYLHTPKYIHAVNILNVDVEADENIKIFCYDADFNFLGVISGNDALCDKTFWIKVQLNKLEEYASDKILCIEVESTIDRELLSYNISGNTSNIRHFSFEIQHTFPITSDTTDLENISNRRHFDNGFIFLPPNYTPDGEPIPLVIFWHGTGGYKFRDKDAMSYKPYLKFITLNGYAVADCSGMSDKFQIGPDSAPGFDCRMTPIALSCFSGLYKFIINNYNIRTDGVHVFGKSNGGLGTVMLGYTQPFPIRSLASLAGSLSMVASFRYSTAINLNYWLSQYDIDHRFNYSGYWYDKHTIEDIESIANSSHKFSSYDPMIVGSDIDPYIYTKLIMDNDYINHTMDNENLMTIFRNAKKYLPQPMKIWHAVDDESVPIETSLIFAQMVNNANGICYLREFPEGTGGHHAVDYSELAPQIKYLTKYGGYIDIPVAYAELVEWFNQW